MAVHLTPQSRLKSLAVGVTPHIPFRSLACQLPLFPDHHLLFPIQSPQLLAQPPGTLALTLATPRMVWAPCLQGQKWDLTSHLVTTCTVCLVDIIPTLSMATALVDRPQCPLSCHPDQPGHPHWRGSTHLGETVTWSSWPAWSCSCWSYWS